MKVSVNVKDLNRMLKVAAKFIDNGTGHVAGVLALSVHDGLFEVTVVALQDHVTVLRQWVDAGPVYNEDFLLVPPEDGFYVVRLKDLAPLKGVEKGSEVTIEAQNDTVSIIAPGLAFDVHTAVAPGEFPNMACHLKDPSETVEIIPEDCECFQYIRPALSTDISRPKFTGAILKDGALVATNGEHLHYCPIPALFGTGTLTGIMAPDLLRFIADGHSGTLKEYCKIEQRKEVKRMKVTEYTECVPIWHVLEAPGFSFRSKPISGQFPDFFRVMPRYNSDDMAEVDAKTLAQAIKPMYAGWKIGLTMAFRNSPDGVKLECAGKPGEKASQPPNRTGMLRGIKLPGLPVCLNPQYVMDALSGFNGEIEFCLKDSNDPVWLGEFNGYKFGRGAVIMPMDPF